MPILQRDSSPRPWQNRRPDYWKGVVKTSFYSNAPWRKARKAYLQSVNFLCQECNKQGRLNEATEVHHIKSINQEDPFNTLSGKYGEPLSFSNLQALCFTCHVTKQNKK